jgi:hypothetical protein
VTALASAKPGPEIFTQSCLPGIGARNHHGRLALQGKGELLVDFSYLALVIVLYALTHTLIWAIGRLRGHE